jgi:hypothetical protein
MTDIAELEAYIAISQVKARYCRTLDTKDWAGYETASTAHQVHSPEIKLDGDTAHVVWAMQDRVVWGADRRPKMGYVGHTGYGHYHERYVRQDGRWRIAAQRLTRLHVDYYYEPPGDAPVGQRD